MDILYIEHIDPVRDLFVTALQHAGWKVEGVKCPDQARALIARHRLPRLMVVNLPTYSEGAAATAMALVADVLEQDPALPVIYTVMAYEQVSAPLPETQRVLRKPFNAARLVITVGGLMHATCVAA